MRATPSSARKFLGFFGAGTWAGIGGAVLLASLVYAGGRAWAPASVLVVNADTYGYLAPALSVLSGNTFLHVYARGFVYPAFVYATTWAAESLLGVVVAQFALYALTSCIGVALFAYVRPLRSSAGAIVAVCLGMIAAVWAIMFWGYAPTYVYTAAILPEFFYIFLGFLGILSVVHLNAQPRIWVWYALSLLVIWANVLVKPNWILCAVFLSAMWFFAVATSPHARIGKFLILVGSLFPVIVGLYIPEQVLIYRHDYRSSRLFGVKTIFCNHSNIIIAAQELGTPVIHDPEPQFVAGVLGFLRGATNDVNGWPLLGFSGDQCMYDSAFDRFMIAHFAGDTEREYSLYVRTFISAILHEPAMYGAKVVRQVWAAASDPFRESGLVLDSDPTIAKSIALTFPRAAYVLPPPQLFEGRARGLVHEQLPAVASVTDRVFRALSPVTVPLYIFVMLALAARARRRSLRIMFPALVSGACWVGHVLVVAASHSFDVGRYVQTGAPFLLLAVFLSLAAASQHLGHAALLRRPHGAP
jgi:hypothetical protein